MTEVEQTLAAISALALPMLREKVNSGKVPVFDDLRLSFSDDGSVRSVVTQPTYSWAAAFEPSDADGFKRDAKFQGFVQQLVALGWLPWKTTDADPTEPGAAMAPAPRGYTDFILSRLGLLAGRVGIEALDPTTTAALLASERQDWVSQDLEYVASVPLLHFGLSDGQPIALETDTSIEAFTNDEKAKQWNPLQPSYGRLDLDQLANSGAQVIRRYRKPRTKALEFMGHLDNQAWSAVSALRLLSDSLVGAAVSFDEIVGPEPGGAMGHRLPELTVPDTTFGKSVLTPDKVPAFLEAYAQLRVIQQKKKTQGLVFAMRRFNLSYTRDHKDDIVVDLSVALEATLLSDVREELKYRVARRGAALLRNSRPPLDTSAALGLLYDIRSNIVHNGLTFEEAGGQRVKDAKWGVQGFIPFAKQLVRETLLEYVRRVAGGASMEQINLQLEEDILRGLSPPVAVELADKPGAAV